MDLADIKVPIEEVRAYLLAKYDARFTLHPRLFEETVASVFRTLGYAADVTAYSHDGGIDVILRKSREVIGVQVKRYKNRIKVEQINSLAGALLRSDITKGMFVTTSSFQSGAPAAASEFEKRGYQIELIDAARFFDALKLARRRPFSNFDEFLAEHPLSRLPTIKGGSLY